MLWQIIAFAMVNGNFSSQQKDTDESIEDVLNRIGYTSYYIFHDLERSKVSDEMSAICVENSGKFFFHVTTRGYSPWNIEGRYSCESVKEQEFMPQCLIPTGECWCGCGGETERRSFFLPGHDKVAESAVLLRVDGSIPEFLARHGYAPGGKIRARTLKRSETETKSTF